MSGTVSDVSATTVVSSPAGINTTLPAGGGQVSGTVALVEGSNVLSVTATDAAGNVGGTSVSVTRDTIASTASIVSPAEGAVLGVSPVTLTIQVSDATATTVAFGANTIQLSAPGGTATGDVSLTEGDNAILVTVTDAAGNQTKVTRNVLLDLSAPIVTITSPANGACFGPGSTTIPVTASIDDLTATTVTSSPAGVSASLPVGGGIAAGTVALSEGSNTITVSAKDATNKVGGASIMVVLDTTAPQVALVAPSNGSVVRGLADLQISASDPLPGSGVAKVDLELDSTPLETLTSAPFETTLDTTSLADGNHTLKAIAFDGKGNSASSTIQVSVDNTAPQISIQTPLNNSFVNGTIDFTAQASDSGSGLKSITMLAGGVAPSVDASITYSVPLASNTRFAKEDTTRRSDGSLVLTARAIDAAGNEATATVTVIADNTLPEKTLVTPAGGSVVSGTIQIEAVASDANLDTIEIKVDGVSLGTSMVSPFKLPFDTTKRLDGAMVVESVVKDRAGNQVSSTAQVTVDNLSFDLDPDTLNLKSKGRKVTGTVEGANVQLLLPLSSFAVELLVPGGNPVTPGFASLGDKDGDNVPDVTLMFDRQTLIGSIQSGIAAEKIEPNGTVELQLRVRPVSGNAVFDIGTARIRILDPGK